MSADALPISTAQFASALETLPLGNLYAKVLELRNSIAHLQRSNTELKQFSEESGGDADCDEAVRENEEVVGRMNSRIEVIKMEVERRGSSWLEAEDLESLRAGATNGHTENGSHEDAEEVGESARNHEESQGQPTIAERRSGGRLTDAQLREQLRSQVGDEDEQEEQGVHL